MKREQLDVLFSQMVWDQLGITTLETRNSDRLDFHEVSVASLKKLMHAVYDAAKNTTEPEPKSAPVMVKIVRGNMEKFPYGFLSEADRSFVSQSVGHHFMGTRIDMNFYQLTNGRMVHIYNATEVGG